VNREAHSGCDAQTIANFCASNQSHECLEREALQGSFENLIFQG
jgi:hypothetical protein